MRLLLQYAVQKEQICAHNRKKHRIGFSSFCAFAASFIPLDKNKDTDMLTDAINNKEAGNIHLLAHQFLLPVK